MAAFMPDWRPCNSMREFREIRVAPTRVPSVIKRPLSISMTLTSTRIALDNTFLERGNRHPIVSSEVYTET